MGRLGDELVDIEYNGLIEGKWPLSELIEQMGYLIRDVAP